jgi:hypothetical protein
MYGIGDIPNNKKGCPKPWTAFNPDYAFEMSKRLTSCKSICMTKLTTTAIPKFLREG